jgi:hypothetical protein
MEMPVSGFGMKAESHALSADVRASTAGRGKGGRRGAFTFGTLCFMRQGAGVMSLCHVGGDIR